MARTTQIPIQATIRQINVSQSDRKHTPQSVKRHMLFHILLIRRVEERLLELKDSGGLHGPVHSSIGQEASAVGSMQLLQREDTVASTHRGHHHFLAKAYNAYCGNEYDPLEAIPEAIPEITERTIAEILGLASGYCRGRGGSMHLADRKAGILGTNAIVAGGVPAATGAAWAHRLSGTDNVGVSFLGDGAINQGVVHEVMNMAAIHNIPIIYFIENNLYAVATHVGMSSAVEHLAQNAVGHGINGLIVDGMDAVAVMKSMEVALREVRLNPNRPFVIEAKTYRFKHQAQGLPGSAFGYRSKEEEARWQQRDPAVQFPKQLEDANELTPEQHEYLSDQADAVVNRAVKAVTREGPGGSLVVPDELFPPADDLSLGLRGDAEELKGLPWKELHSFSQTRRRKVIEVIPEVIGRRMDTDDRVVVIGEEVGLMRGGAFMATKGLHKTYPDRVINTPISEAGFSGMGLGLSLEGYRPIVEIMYPDFVLVAADQLLNQIGKWRYMYGNQFDVPLVVRTKVGIGTGYGAQHSLEPASLFSLYPGWRIVAPSNPFDYVGLFNSAIRVNDPVLVIEHHFLYEENGEIPDDRDYAIPFGKARILREGGDVTIVSYSYMSCKALNAAEKLAAGGIDAEVIDLRTVDFLGIDYETIGRSLEKTGLVLVAEEGMISGGVGAQLVYEIQDRFFDLLDGEIKRVAGPATVMAVSRLVEERQVPDETMIVRTVKTMMPEWNET